MTLLFMSGFENEPASSGPYGSSGPYYGTVGATGRFSSQGWQPPIGSGNYSVFRITPSAKVTVGAAVRPVTQLQGNIHGGIGLMGDTAGVWHIFLNCNASGQLVARLGGYNGTIVATSAAGLIQLGVWNYWELQGTVADSGGTIKVRLNNVEVINYVGDTKNAGTSTNIDAVSFGGESWNPYIDDVYICDGLTATNNNFLGDSRVIGLLPNGNGTYSQGVGSDSNSVDNYLLVDEATPSAADYVNIALGNKDTYNYADLAVNPTVIRGVSVTSNVTKTETGTATFAPLIKLGATEVTGTAVPLAVGSTTVKMELFETKPGGGAWSASDVNSAEFGVVAS